MNLTNAFEEYEKLLSVLNDLEPAKRKTADRIKVWQLWGWLMTMNLARLSPDATIETLDLMIRRTPLVGFEEDHVERLFIQAEKMGMLNAVGVPEQCVAMLCTDKRSVWNDTLPPSILDLEEIDLATDSTCIVVAGSGSAKKRKINALEYFTEIWGWQQAPRPNLSQTDAQAVKASEIGMVDEAVGGEWIKDLTTRIIDYRGRRQAAQGASSTAQGSATKGLKRLERKEKANRGLFALWAGNEDDIQKEEQGIMEYVPDIAKFALEAREYDRALVVAPHFHDLWELPVCYATNDDRWKGQLGSKWFGDHGWQRLRGFGAC